jgi:hypothetical protein
MPPDQVDLSMGHVLAYNAAYIQFTDEELLKNFKDVEPYLSIYYEALELEEKRKEQDEKIDQQDKLIESQQKEMKALKLELIEIKELFEKIKMHLD